MKTKLIILLFTALLLTSCTRVTLDKADEIRMNTWSAELENGSVVTLSFQDDNAEFKINGKDKDARADLKGLCVIDDKKILIYNQSESESYFFDYKIKNNTLILNYNGGSMILTRQN